MTPKPGKKYYTLKQQKIVTCVCTGCYIVYSIIQLKFNSPRITVTYFALAIPLFVFLAILNGRPKECSDERAKENARRSDSFLLIALWIGLVSFAFIMMVDERTYTLSPDIMIIVASIILFLRSAVFLYYDKFSKD